VEEIAGRCRNDQFLEVNYRWEGQDEEDANPSLLAGYTEN